MTRREFQLRATGGSDLCTPFWRPSLRLRRSTPGAHAHDLRPSPLRRFGPELAVRAGVLIHQHHLNEATRRLGSATLVCTLLLLRR